MATKTYFLQALNTPVIIAGIRIAAVLIAVFLIGAYIYAMKKSKEEKEDERKQ